MGKKRNRGRRAVDAKKNAEAKETTKTTETKEVNNTAETTDAEELKEVNTTTDIEDEEEAREVEKTAEITDEEEAKEVNTTTDTKPIGQLKAAGGAKTAGAKKATENVKQDSFTCHGGVCEKLRDELEHCKLRAGRVELITKLKLVSDKSDELRRLLDLLTQTGDERRCFMPVGNLLMSRSDKEVIPILQSQLYTSHSAICQIKKTIRDVDEELMRLGDNPDHEGIW